MSLLGYACIYGYVYALFVYVYVIHIICSLRISCVQYNLIIFTNNFPFQYLPGAPILSAMYPSKFHTYFL